jgi:hypothetical protein
VGSGIPSVLAPTPGPVTLVEDAAKNAAKNALKKMGLGGAVYAWLKCPLAVILGTLAFMGVARTVRAVTGSITFTTSAVSCVYGAVFHKMWVAKQFLRLAAWTVVSAIVYSNVFGQVLDVGPQSPEVTRFLRMSDEFSRHNITEHDAELKLFQVSNCFKKWHHGYCKKVQENVLNITPALISVYKDVLVSDRLSFSGDHGLNMSYKNRSMPLFKVSEIRKDNATEFEKLYAVYEHLSDYISLVRPFNHTAYQNAGVWDATRMVFDYATLYLPGMDASAPLPLASFHNIPSEEAIMMFHVDLSKKAAIVRRKNGERLSFWRDARSLFSFTRTSGSVISLVFPHLYSVSIFSDLACLSLGRWIDNLGSVSTDVFLDNDDFCLIGTCPDDIPPVFEVNGTVYHNASRPPFLETTAQPAPYFSFAVNLLRSITANTTAAPIPDCNCTSTSEPAVGHNNSDASKPAIAHNDCDDVLDFVIECAKKRSEYVREHICTARDFTPAGNLSAGPFRPHASQNVSAPSKSWTYTGFEMVAYFAVMNGARWTMNALVSSIPLGRMLPTRYNGGGLASFVPNFIRG